MGMNEGRRRRRPARILAHRYFPAPASRSSPAIGDGRAQAPGLRTPRKPGRTIADKIVIFAFADIAQGHGLVVVL
jgi:hypothetical protein